MQRKDWVVALVQQVTSVDKPTAELLVERLMEESVLHLGHGNADIDIIVDMFADTFGSTKVSQHDRWAANRLAGKYGSQAVVGIIRLLGERSQDRYAPIPRSVADLETKWVSVLNFLRKSGDTETIDA